MAEPGRAGHKVAGPGTLSKEKAKEPVGSLLHATSRTGLLGQGPEKSSSLTREGLPASEVRAIARGRDGVLHQGKGAVAGTSPASSKQPPGRGRQGCAPLPLSTPSESRGRLFPRPRGRRFPRPLAVGNSLALSRFAVPSSLISSPSCVDIISSSRGKLFPRPLAADSPFFCRGRRFPCPLAVGCSLAASSSLVTLA